MNNKTIIFLMVSVAMIFFANTYTIGKSNLAGAGEISIFGRYKHMSALKHDFFKLFFMTFIPGLLLNDTPLIFSLKYFNRSLFGRALIVAITIAFYHTTLQPMLNFLPRF
jgi:hypothetical protein